MIHRRFHRPGYFGPIFFFLLPALCVCAYCAPLRGADAAPETVAAAAPGANAADGELGAGLHYFRVTNLAGQIVDLREALAKHPALVVDLRGVEASMADARALNSALLPSPPPDAKARVARFVLVNRATGTAIPFTLGAGLPEGGMPGVLVIAPAAAGVPADVMAPGSVEDDALACEAIAKGADVAGLVNWQPEKKRYDEAVLAREHRGLPEPEEGEEQGPGPGADNADSEGKKPGEEKQDQGKPVVDSVLQTAVHVHRSLLALGRL